MSLKGKTIMVTGGATRVGKMFSLAAARSGANVVVHYSSSHAEALRIAEEIKALGAKAFLLQGDLNDPQVTAGLIQKAWEFAPLFALINSASIFEQLDLEHTTLDKWNRNMMINLTAPFLLSQAFAKESGTSQGRIVNIVDWRWQRPGADHLPYAISKSALAALTQALALGLAPRINVNALALGAILPPSDGASPEGIPESTPAGRWATADEVGEALIFLLDGPAYVTGDIIYVDGGRHSM